MRAFRIAGLLLLLTSWSLSAWAQYFGRNKVQYESFSWRVLRTPHFEIYYYPEEEVAVRDAARMAERWYQRHSRTFLHEFGERKPIIFYADDADFHQTNAISGEIGEGTGGVTEALKERVIMPFTGIYRENDHVLGHELVHSFQYDIALNRSDSLSRFNLALLPLWLVEGMAEYLSLGRNDPHTAMWLRDAALRDDLPTIRQLTRDLRYFPYRYGQAYLATSAASTAIRPSPSCTSWAGSWASIRPLRLRWASRPTRFPGNGFRRSRIPICRCSKIARPPSRPDERCWRPTSTRARSTWPRRSVPTGATWPSFRSGTCSRSTCLWPTPRPARCCVG